MRLGVTSRRVADLERRIAVLEAQLAHSVETGQAHVAEAAYWRDKAESLVDSALMRKGEAAGPVFAKAPAQAFANDPTAGLFAAINREIAEGAHAVFR